MKFIKVVLLVIIFVPLYLGLDVVQVNLDVSGLVNPSFYLSSLQRGGVFASVPDAAVELFRQGVSGMPAEDQAAVEAALREAVDPAWTVELVRPAVTDICLYVKGKVPALSAEIPVGEIFDCFFQAFAKNRCGAACYVGAGGSPCPTGIGRGPGRRSRPRLAGAGWLTREVFAGEGVQGLPVGHHSRGNGCRTRRAAGGF